jgi:hypothetical protein
MKKVVEVEVEVVICWRTRRTLEEQKERRAEREKVGNGRAFPAGERAMAKSKLGPLVKKSKLI